MNHDNVTWKMFVDLAFECAWTHADYAFTQRQSNHQIFICLELKVSVPSSRA